MPRVGSRPHRKAHQTRWRAQGYPPQESFIDRCLLAARDRIDFSGLSPLLRLELQYAVQCRADQARIRLPAPVVNWAIRQARDAHVSSLLDLSARQWADRAGPKTNSYPAFLVFARDVVEMLHEGTGWEVEYPKDIWRLDRLPGLTTNAGRPNPRNRLRFDRIAQPWLRALVMRWSRLRLSSGLAVGTVVNDVTSLTRFSTFLAEAVPEVDGLAGVDRAALERYLAWLATCGLGHGAKEDAVTGLGMFFQASVSTTGTPACRRRRPFFAGDLSRRYARVSRRLAEHVMAQVEAAVNLEGWPTPAGRLVTVILIQCGLRATDACTLGFDCLIHDRADTPYLRYFNHKMRREAAVPIDPRPRGPDPDPAAACGPAVAGAASASIPAAHVQRRRPPPAQLLQLPRHAQRLARPVRGPRRARRAGPPDSAPVGPHFACRLINRDVPQEVVRVLLDHESTQMTAHYARITDQSVRRR